MTHQNPGSERVRGTAVGKRVQGNFGGGVLGLPESGAVVRAFEDLSVKVNGGLEPRRVIRTLSDARVGRQIETAPLRQLLKLVLVHLAPTSLPPSLSLSLSVRRFSTPILHFSRPRNRFSHRGNASRSQIRVRIHRSE